MSHCDASTHPAGVYSKGNLASTAQAVNGTKAFSATWCVLIGGAAERVVTFRARSTGATYFTQRVPTAGIVPLGGFRFYAGLEVLTDSATADVGITLGYVELGN